VWFLTNEVKPDAAKQSVSEKEDKKLKE